MKRKVVIIELETEHSNTVLKQLYKELRPEGTTVRQVQVNLIKKKEEKRK